MFTPHTPAAHEVLALAAEIAGETPVGSHHILEAIVQQPESAAAPNRASTWRRRG